MDSNSITKLRIILSKVYLNVPTPAADDDLNENISTLIESEKTELIRLINLADPIVNDKTQNVIPTELSNRITKIKELLNDDQNDEDQISTNTDGDNSIGGTSNNNLPSENGLKRKINTLYAVDQPKNIKYHRSDLSPHIFPWNPSEDRGYDVIVTGSNYVKGIMNDWVRDCKVDLGNVSKVLENDKMATITTDSEKNQKKLISLITEDQTLVEIEAKASKYRHPIIKFWVNSKMAGNKDWNSIVKEIKDFNFKGDLNEKFCEFVKVFGSPYGQNVMLAIQIDPMLRDYIVRVKHGKILWKGRSHDVIDHFAIRRCFNCGTTRHFACQGKQEKCLRCAGPHNIATCKSTDPKCPSCSGRHEAFTLDCPNMKEAIDAQMSKIDYTYKEIMYKKGF